jgi:hypothetical protein
MAGTTIDAEAILTDDARCDRAIKTFDIHDLLTEIAQAVADIHESSKSPDNLAHVINRIIALENYPAMVESAAKYGTSMDDICVVLFAIGCFEDGYHGFIRALEAYRTMPEKAMRMAGGSTYTYGDRTYEFRPQPLGFQEEADKFMRLMDERGGLVVKAIQEHTPVIDSPLYENLRRVKPEEYPNSRLTRRCLGEEPDNIISVDFKNRKRK